MADTPAMAEVIVSSRLFFRASEAAQKGFNKGFSKGFDVNISRHVLFYKSFSGLFRHFVSDISPTEKRFLFSI